MQNTKTLIFGATGGTFGKVLVDQLLPDHESGSLKLAAVVRRPDAVAALTKRGIEVHQYDLDKAELEGLDPLIEVMRGVARVYLLTGYNVRMLAHSKAVIDAAVRAGVSHLVHLGANGAADTTTAYSGWHRLIEAYIERSGIGFTHLRPSQTMQTLPMMHQLAGAPGVIESYIGEARIGWVDATDVAAVAAEVLRKPSAHEGKAYPLATVQASVAEIVDILSAVTGARWRHESRDARVFYEKVMAGGVDAIYMGSVRDSFTKTRAGKLPILEEVYDNVERLIGRPPTTLRTYLERNRGAFTSVA